MSVEWCSLRYCVEEGELVSLGSSGSVITFCAFLATTYVTSKNMEMLV